MIRTVVDRSSEIIAYFGQTAAMNSDDEL